jgi:alpha-beta hydrolase superfamily lysophospholipase
MRRIIRPLILLLSVALICIMGTYLLQEKIIFQPTQLQLDHQFRFKTPFEEFFIETKDGARLNGLRFSLAESKGVIVYYHGNAGDLQRWGEITSFFLQFGYEVIVMDYRTYGKSTGELSEKNLYNDAQLFYDRALTYFAEDKIIVYGRSLGASIATKIASENSPSKLILETPFYSLTDLVKEKFSPLPVSGLLKYRFPSNQFIKNTECPVIVIHGTNDAVVPYRSGLKLYEEIPESQGTLITIEGGGHNDLINFKEYEQAIRKVLQ